MLLSGGRSLQSLATTLTCLADACWPDDDSK